MVVYKGLVRFVFLGEKIDAKIGPIIWRSFMIFFFTKIIFIYIEKVQNASLDMYPNHIKKKESFEIFKAATKMYL